VELTARSVILDLLSTVRRGAMPVRALVEAGALFGFAENNVRVSLSKLYAEGRAARDERGRYRLGPATAAVSDQVRRWRRLEEQHRPWHGDWVAVHQARRGRGPARVKREHALALLGFRELEPGLALRPDNLRGGVEGVRVRYAGLSGDGDPSTLVFGLRELAPASDLRARGLWDAAALGRGYRAALRALEASRARLGRLSDEEAMIETFVVGGAALRQLVLDPLLPEPILDPAPRRALVEAMRGYDELGRRAWAPFLARHGVPHRSAPEGWRAALGALPAEAQQGGVH